MGRPDLSRQRKQEILDAFERCVARYGLAETSLERVAQEAGMKRSILRHYVGNREQLVEALAQRVVLKYQADFRKFAATAKTAKNPDYLIRNLFPDQPVETAESVMVIESLIAAAERNDKVRKCLVEYIDDLVDQMVELLHTWFPRSTRKQRRSAAYGLIGIWFNQESLAPLRLSPKYVKAARASAKILIDSLG